MLLSSLGSFLRSYSSNYGGYVAQVYAVVDYEPAGYPTHVQILTVEM